MSRTAIPQITSQPTTSEAQTIPSTITYVTPDVPLVRIQPSTLWSKLKPRELWAYRELLYFLVWRDVKVRYKQTILGAAWALLQPLLLMLIFTFFFSRLAGIRTNVPYPLFAYAGLVPWLFFAHAVNNSGNSLIVSSNLITKVYFPRILLPMSSALSGLFDLAIGFTLLLALLPLYGVSPRWQLLCLPVCTGGRHRSVHVAERVAGRLRAAGFSPRLDHRDLAAPPRDGTERSAGGKADGC